MAFCTGCGQQIEDKAQFCTHCGARQQPSGAVPEQASPPEPMTTKQARTPDHYKSQTLAAILCALLGGLGAHRFYLGSIGLGVVYVLFCCTGIPALVAWVETFVIAFSSQESWARKYNQGVLTPPTHVAVKVLVVIFPLFMAIALAGIVAAIAIPAYADYQQRAKSAAVLAALQGGKAALTEFLGRQKETPLDEGTLEQIKSAVGLDKNVLGVDAFAYGKYGDIGAKLVSGGREGMLYLVTRDGGQTWNCVGVDLARGLPKECETNGALQRPEIPKPVPKVGLWEQAFFQGALEACSQRARERGDATGPEVCECILTKAAREITQEQAERGDLPVKERLQQLGQECRPQTVSVDEGGGSSGGAASQ